MTTRPPFLFRTLMLALTAICPLHSSSPPPRPNILLLMADDLGWADTGFNGNGIVRTPHLDALAAKGLVFDRFYAASAVCSPTRGSCLTGRHPQRYGVFTANSGHLPKAEITLPELLRAEGYTTGHFGKWHLGTLTKTKQDANRGGPKGAAHFAPPRDHGFDASFATESKVPTYDPMLKPPNAKKTWWDPIDDRSTAISYGTAYWNHDGSRATNNLAGDDSRVLMDRAIPFIENAVADGKPFFATIWFHAPHLPVVAGPDDTAPYRKLNLDGHTRNYYGCITALDRQVGRLSTKLKTLGAAGNTLVFFCSDNGPEGKAGSSPGSAKPFRGRKRDLYEGGVRVPAFAVWPDHIAPGQRTATPVVTSDFLPTMLDILKLKMPDARPVDGASMVPILDNPAARNPRQSPVFFHFGRKFSAMNNQFKAISTDKGKSWSLYQLDSDPAENKNIAVAHPEVLDNLRDAFEIWRASCERSRTGADYPDRPPPD